MQGYKALMKRILKIVTKYIPTIVISFSVVALFATALSINFSKKPFVQITSPDQLYGDIDVTKNYYIRNQYLSLRDEWKPLGTKEKPFSGIFDGGGSTIVNMNLVSDDTGEETLFGMFGYVTGVIQNIKIYLPGSIQYAIKGETPLFGSLLAAHLSGTIRNCTISFGGSIDFSHIKNGTFGALSCESKGIVENVKTNGWITVKNCDNISISNHIAVSGDGSIEKNNTANLEIRYEEQ